jgi:hypothetical protein
MIAGPGAASVNALVSSPNPRAKAASQFSSTLRSASVSTKPAGVAPLAARSERFTRKAFLATVCGGSSDRKWTPSTMASVVTMMSWPSAFRTAASSLSPNAPGSVASGLK